MWEITIASRGGADGARSAATNGLEGVVTGTRTDHAHRFNHAIKARISSRYFPSFGLSVVIFAILLRVKSALKNTTYPRSAKFHSTWIQSR